MSTFCVRSHLAQPLEHELKPLCLEEVLHLKNEQVQIVDIRDSADFAGGHMVETLNIGLGGKFAIWAGTILDRP